MNLTIQSYLKNLDKIPIITLERFNKLFKGIKTLILNEEKFNRIIKQKNKLYVKQ